MAPKSDFVFLRHDDYALTLLGVAVVVVVARLAGVLFRRIGQPPVIGEVVAGVTLGTVLFGRYSTALFPAEARPLLRILATVGLVIFMFFVGLEIDLRHLGGRYRISTVVALAGSTIPFAFGVVLGLVLHRTHNQAGLFGFCLFMGAAMSITAFPVLARILIESKLFDTPLGVVVMAAAAGDDALTWATLAFVVAVISATGAWHLLYICALAVGFSVVMVKFVRPRLTPFGNRPVDASSLSAIVVGLFACSFLTSAAGLHEIFGAFLFGAVFPRGRLANDVRSNLDSIVVILLPVFFVTAGFGVDIVGVGWQGVWQLVLILIVACAGKLVGAGLGARCMGVRGREAAAIGVLMNTRGLTELVVLGIGRDLGILDAPLYSMLVLMAVVTTVATSPLLRLIRPDPTLGAGP